MIRYLVARFTLVAVVAASCAQPPETPDPDAAPSTIAQARARAEDLANSTQNYQPVRFVSAIEQVRPPRPVTRTKPDTVVEEGKDPVHVEPVALPTEVEGPALQADSATETASAPRVPSIIPRDAPEPAAVGGGGGGWRGRDPGPDMGTVIGVVLRGGRVDPGHCPRHPRPPTQIPNRIPQR